MISLISTSISQPLPANLLLRPEESGAQGQWNSKVPMVECTKREEEEVYVQEMQPI